ncbi:MAG TPA: FlgD immunoglobulin-like domain containing protein [Candidatus Acidoferrales bacterium]|nr:FlgD immunoglobulin-like domain containing protein [Candidatus Acidoferrales bacterium]
MLRLSRLVALAALALAGLLSLSPPAHALKVATWNMLAYENPGEGPGLPSPYITARQPNFRIIMAALDPDLIMTEEMNSSAAKDSFLLDVLGVVEPGQWSGTWLNVNSGEGIGIFWKTALMSVSNVQGIADGGPRNALAALVKPTGYVKNGAWFRVYAVHLKAGNASSDSTTRAAEANSLRSTLNTTSTGVVGTNFLFCGDTNLYGANEECYIHLTESQTNNNGRLFDELSMPGSWHQLPGYAPYYSQCPCNSCTTVGQSGGGLDDRFDVFLTSTSMQDGAGLDYVPASYTPFGNDGQHFNTDINAYGFNNAVGLTIADALHDASDHIPVMITLQLPAHLSAPSQLSFGRAIVGGSPTATLAVGDGAAAPAATLTYSLGASSGFSAPSGGFSAAAGAGANLHALGMDASVIGATSGSVTITSNDNDTTSKAVLLDGQVVAHASPSLDSLTVTTSSLLDFGDHTSGTFTDGAVRVFDQGYGALEAQLAVTGATLTGDPRFALDGSFVPATLGAVGQTWNVHFDDSSVDPDSTYTGTLTFATSDEPLPGALPAASLSVALRAHVTSVLDAGPGAYALRFLPPRPNPTHGGTDFAFELPSAARVSLAIYDLNGRRVATLADGDVGQGRHTLRWNAQNDAGGTVSAGLYFARFETPGLRRVARLVLLP